MNQDARLPELTGTWVTASQPCKQNWPLSFERDINIPSISNAPRKEACCIACDKQGCMEQEKSTAALENSTIVREAIPDSIGRMARLASEWQPLSVEIGTDNRLQRGPICCINERKRETFDAHSALRTRREFGCFAAVVTLPAYKGCEIITSYNVVHRRGPKALISGRCLCSSVGLCSTIGCSAAIDRSAASSWTCELCLHIL